MSTIKLIIDSRDRESLLDTPAQYTYKSMTNLNNVQSINLINANVPFSRYIIHSYNNILFYFISGQAKILTLTEGNYTGTELATLLSNAFDNNTDTITVTYNSNTDKLTFTTDTNNFILYFNPASIGGTTNSLYRILGFNRYDYTAADNKIIAPFRINLEIERCIYLTINNAILNVSNNNSINKSFAIIYKKFEDNNTTINVGDCNKLTFNPPLNNFNLWKIKFTDYDENVYDFHNQDHQLEFLIKVLPKTD